MNELTSKIHQLKSAISNAGCLPEEIDKFEAVYGPIDEEYRDFLLWSNGIKFENYELKIPSYNEYKLRVGDDEEFISLYFYHLASLGAVQECIDFANAEVRDLTDYDMGSKDYFINYFHPIAYDVVGRDYVCIPKASVNSGVYLVNWWEPSSYGYLPFPQVKIADSLSDLVDLLLTTGVVG